MRLTGKYIFRTALAPRVWIPVRPAAAHRIVPILNGAGPITSHGRAASTTGESDVPALWRPATA
jgi:hypothetical protein